MFKRILQPDLVRLSKQYPVVTLTGPRQSGKTTLCRASFPKLPYVNLEDLETRQRAIQDPKGFLAQYPNGAIFDEIQRTPDLPSYIQVIVDDNDFSGKFILTGSQQFEVTNQINQSLAGRTAILKLLPLSYIELEEHFKNHNYTIEDILYTGCYPRVYHKALNPTEALSFYLSTYVERDIRSIINLKDLNTFERFLKLCASQIGQLLNYSKLANDCGVNQNTIKSWLSVLEASAILFQLPPHFKNFRKRLTKSTKLYFYDTGLAAYLLGISNKDQITNHPLKGELFENFIVTEFIKNRFNYVHESNLYFFRDHVGNEVDLILDYGNDLISVEIKSSKTFSHNYTKGLKQYHDLSQEQNTKQIIIYAGENSYLYNDIFVYSYKDLDKIFHEIN